MADWRPDGRAASQPRRQPAVPVPGDLLVASVLVAGDMFDQAVVLVVDADEAGTTGVVLNRPADEPVETHLPGWGEVATPPARLAVGGPVSRDGALCLARLGVPAATVAGWSRCYDDVGLLQLDTPLELVHGRYRDLRVFVGYAGWGPGQLADELEAGLWHVLPSRASDPFDEDPDTLWRRVLRRAPGELAYFSTWTPDPDWN